MAMWLEDLPTTLTRDNNEQQDFSLRIHGLPGGAKSFEVITKFCYDMKLELNPRNIVAIRCAAEYLDMSENYGEYNLIYHCENLLEQLLGDWTNSLQVLKSCNEESVLSFAKLFRIVSRFIKSLVEKVLYPGNAIDKTSQIGGLSSDETCNGINYSINSPLREYRDWWYEDISNLRLDDYRRFIFTVMRGGIMSLENIIGSLLFYLKRHHPDVNIKPPLSRTRKLIQDIVTLIPLHKDNVSTEKLFKLLDIAIKVRVGSNCLKALEMLVGSQLEHAEFSDLLDNQYVRNQ